MIEPLSVEDTRSICRNALRAANSRSLDRVIAMSEEYVWGEADPGLCVYLLFRFGHLVYVGQTRELDRRLCQHARVKTFDRIRFIRSSADEVALLESTLIHTFDPPQNAWRATRSIRPEKVAPLTRAEVDARLRPE